MNNMAGSPESGDERVHSEPRQSHKMVNGVTARWHGDHSVMKYAFFGKPGTGQIQPPTDLQTVLHEMRWNADIQNQFTRKLINETHVIFLQLQELGEVGGASRQASQLKFSRHYRSVIRDCISLIQATQDQNSFEESQELQKQCSLLGIIDLIWHLCEILFVENLPGGSVLPKLLEWVRMHFDEASRLTTDVCSSEQPSRHPHYWSAIFHNVFQGRLDITRELLSQHHDRELQAFDAFASMDELLNTMPTYQMFLGQSTAEFYARWNKWQQECHHQHNDGVFSSFPDLDLLCQILCGDDGALRKVSSFCPTWYQMLVAKLLFSNPTIKVYDLQYHTQACLDMFADGRSQMAYLDKILLGALEFDVHTVIKECSDCLGNWWFVAHLTDLLHHCGQLEAHQHNYGVDLREFLLLEYASSLMSQGSLWRVAADYFLQCPQFGRYYLEEYVEHLPLENEKKAVKVLSLCERLELHTQVKTICKVMSVQAQRNGRLASALAWCLRSKDSAFAAFLADRFLEEYCCKGDFSCLDLLDNLGSSMLLSDRLTFLGKYREFHRLYSEGDFKGSANLLISLVTSRLAPKRLWVTLLTDALPLLEHEKVIFNSDQTHELMRCLEEIETSFNRDIFFESSKVKDGHSNKISQAMKQEASDKVGLLHLALARNLARAILQESHVSVQKL